MKISREEEGTAAPLVPARLTLRSLKEAAAGCRACPLWERGTQTVFGEGLLRSRLILVGEQPGDSEDRQGHPFVGPAGPGPGPGPGDRRDRPSGRLRHERGQALQMGPQGQTAPSSETERPRDWRLPPMAGRGDRPHPARGIGGHGRDGGPGAAGQGGAGDPGPRQDAVQRPRPLRDGDGPPILDPARPLRRRPENCPEGICGRFAGRGRDAEEKTLNFLGPQISADKRRLEEK